MVELNRTRSQLLLVAGLATLVGSLLPISFRLYGVLWPWQLAYSPSFVIATAVLMVVGVLTLVLARRSDAIGAGTLPLTLLMAATVLAVFGQSDLLSAVGADRVYNLGPLALAVGLVAGADASLTLFDQRRVVASRLAAAAGCGCLIVFLASPTAYGTVVAEMSSYLRFALEPGLSLSERVFTMLPEVLVVVLFAATVFVATGVFDRRPHGFERMGMLLGAFALLVLAVGARETTDSGLLSFLVVARVVCIWLALTSFATALCTSVIQSQSQVTIGVWGALAVSAAAIALVLSPAMDSRDSWSVKNAPSWAEALYEDAIPALAAAPQGSKERQAAARIVLALAEAEPSLRDALAQLLPLIDEPGYYRRALTARVREVNDTAREAGLPFYLDADIALIGSAPDASWYLNLQAYRIHASRSAQAGAQEFPMLWVESTNPRRISSQGFTEPEGGYGVVILDQVRRNWDKQLAPSLIDGTRSSSYVTSYAQYSSVLRRTLERAVSERAPGRWQGDASAAFERYLVCLRHQQRGITSELSARYCPALVEEIEPVIIEALAQNVERHELQHMIDDQRGGVALPDAVRSALHGYSARNLNIASAELSAYLAEVADGPMPHLSLAHLVAIATSRPSSPEAAAGEIARWFLSDSGSWDEPFALSADELRDRAGYAYLQLFGRKLPTVVTREPTHL